MKKETITLLTILGIVGAGILWLTQPQVTLYSTPQTHQQIINDIQIVEAGATETFSLSAVCVDSGTREFSKEWPLSVFEVGEEYTQSTWIWQRHGDTEACMTIWGPGDDGVTYDLEVGRLVGAVELRIYYQSDLQRTMPRVTAAEIYDVMPGYVWFNVVLD